MYIHYYIILCFIYTDVYQQYAYIKRFPRAFEEGGAQKKSRGCVCGERGHSVSNFFFSPFWFTTFFFKWLKRTEGFCCRRP